MESNHDIGAGGSVVACTPKLPAELWLMVLTEKGMFPRGYRSARLVCRSWCALLSRPAHLSPRYTRMWFTWALQLWPTLSLLPPSTVHSGIDWEQVVRDRAGRKDIVLESGSTIAFSRFAVSEPRTRFYDFETYQHRKLVPKPILASEPFIAAKKPELKASRPDLNSATGPALLVAMWNQGTKEEKAPYKEVAKQDQLRFKRELAAAVFIEPRELAFLRHGIIVHHASEETSLDPISDLEHTTTSVSGSIMTLSGQTVPWVYRHTWMYRGPVDLDLDGDEELNADFMHITIHKPIIHIGDMEISETSCFALSDALETVSSVLGIAHLKGQVFDQRYPLGFLYAMFAPDGDIYPDTEKHELLAYPRSPRQVVHKYHPGKPRGPVTFSWW
eukprot:TRINITY_DN6146_c0_g1_i6.p1 TRINITY_DN6146_c0_g1~~TRINITY_DN6146_c0_g1_i6.p1  ORF type:complete len:388 (+),score=38.21 TRINITY_DN6146_c0_g1_i6:92-1255(+)